MARFYGRLPTDLLDLTPDDFLLNLELFRLAVRLRVVDQYGDPPRAQDDAEG